MNIPDVLEGIHRIIDKNNDCGRPVLSDYAIECLNECIWAMERHMPRLVYQKESQWTHKFFDHCPECGDRLRSDDEYHPNYCEFCGQAIDWGDEE